MNFITRVWALDFFITTFSLHLTQCCCASLFIHLRSLPLFWPWGKGREETLIISLLANFELIIWVFAVSLSNDDYASVIKPTIACYILFTTTYIPSHALCMCSFYIKYHNLYTIWKLSLLIIAIYRDRFLCKEIWSQSPSGFLTHDFWSINCLSLVILCRDFML